MARGMRRRRVAAVALAVCAALVRTSAPHETLVHELSVSPSSAVFVATAAAETDAHKATVSASDHTPALDEDDTDDSVAFTFAAAQQEAARLLSAFDSDALLDDDDGDDECEEDGDEYENDHEEDAEYGADATTQAEDTLTDVAVDDEASASIETPAYDASPREPATEEQASDSSVHRVTIRLTRSAAVSSDAAAASAPVAVVKIHAPEGGDASPAGDDAQAIESFIAALDAAVSDDEEIRHDDASAAASSSASPVGDEAAQSSSGGAAFAVVEHDARSAFGAALVKIRAVIYPDAPLDEDASARRESEADERVDTVDLVDDEAPDAVEAPVAHSDERLTSDEAQSLVLDEGSYNAFVASDDAFASDSESQARDEDAPSGEQDAPGELLSTKGSVSENEDVDASDSVMTVSELEAADESSDAAERATALSVEPFESTSSAEMEETAVADAQQSSEASALDADSLDQCLSTPDALSLTAEATDPVAPPSAPDKAVTSSSSSAFHEIVLEMATAMEQVVYELRLGRRPQVPVAFTNAAARVQWTARAYSRSVSEPIAETVDALSTLVSATSADAAQVLDSGRVQALVLSERIGQRLRDGGRYVRSASHEAIDWCHEVWSTYEAVRVVGRNLHGLALLLLAALLFSSLYCVAAAVPDVALAYIQSLDDVTRAQLKIFAVVLALLGVYHAHVLAWFWLALLVTLAYYYWSGHVVITVEFK